MLNFLVAGLFSVHSTFHINQKSMFRIIPIALFCLLAYISNGQTASEDKINNANKALAFLNRITDMNKSGNRAFTLKFDTLSIFFAGPEEPESLVSTMPVTYDAWGRIKDARIIEAGFEDYYQYRYNYTGDDNRFSHLDYYLHSGGEEHYAGVQIHLYDDHGRLISSRELDKDNQLIYGDSLSLEFNGLGQIVFYEYLYFQLGRWNSGGKVYDVQYSGQDIVGYNADEAERGHSGKDTIVSYRYEDVRFLNDDSSILFPDFDEFFEIDSLGVDNFFLSSRDAAKAYVKQPVQYLKYRTDGSGALVQSAVYDPDKFISIISDPNGKEIYRIEYSFDGQGRLKGIHKVETGQVPEVSTFEYNELGRMARYIFTSDSVNFRVNNLYVTDDKDRLSEYYQNLEDTNNSITNILRFGYRGENKTYTGSILEACVFPNPAGHAIYIKTPQSIYQEMQVSMMGNDGRLVFSGRINFTAGVGSIPVAKVPPGTYLLLIKDGKKAYKATVVII